MFSYIGVVPPTSIRRHPLLLTAGSGSCACRSLNPRAEDYRANHKVEMATRLAYCPNFTVGQTSRELTRRACQAKSFSGECSYSLSVVVPTGIISTTMTCMVLGSSSSRSPLAGCNLQYRPFHCVLIDLGVPFQRGGCTREGLGQPDLDNWRPLELPSYTAVPSCRIV